MSNKDIPSEIDITPEELSDQLKAEKLARIIQFCKKNRLVNLAYQTHVLAENPLMPFYETQQIEQLAALVEQFAEALQAIEAPNYPNIKFAMSAIRERFANDSSFELMRHQIKELLAELKKLTQALGLLYSEDDFIKALSNQYPGANQLAEQLLAPLAQLYSQAKGKLAKAFYRLAQQNVIEIKHITQLNQALSPWQDVQVLESVKQAYVFLLKEIIPQFFYDNEKQIEKACQQFITDVSGCKNLSDYLLKLNELRKAIAPSNAKQQQVRLDFLALRFAEKIELLKGIKSPAEQYFTARAHKENLFNSQLYQRRANVYRLNCFHNIQKLTELNELCGAVINSYVALNGAEHAFRRGAEQERYMQALYLQHGSLLKKLGQDSEADALIAFKNFTRCVNLLPKAVRAYARDISALKRYAAHQSLIAHFGKQQQRLLSPDREVETILKELDVLAATKLRYQSYYKLYSEVRSELDHLAIRIGRCELPAEGVSEAQFSALIADLQAKIAAFSECNTQVMLEQDALWGSQYAYIWERLQQILIRIKLFFQRQWLGLTRQKEYPNDDDSADGETGGSGQAFNPPDTYRHLAGDLQLDDFNAADQEKINFFEAKLQKLNKEFDALKETKKKLEASPVRLELQVEAEDTNDLNFKK